MAGNGTRPLGGEISHQLMALSRKTGTSVLPTQSAEFGQHPGKDWKSETQARRTPGFQSCETLSQVRSCAGPKLPTQGDSSMTNLCH